MRLWKWIVNHFLRFTLRDDLEPEAPRSALHQQKNLAWWHRSATNWECRVLVRAIWTCSPQTGSSVQPPQFGMAPVSNDTSTSDSTSYLRSRRDSLASSAFYYSQDRVHLVRIAVVTTMGFLTLLVVSLSFLLLILCSKIIMCRNTVMCTAYTNV